MSLQALDLLMRNSLRCEYQANFAAPSSNARIEPMACAMVAAPAAYHLLSTSIDTAVNGSQAFFANTQEATTTSFNATEALEQIKTALGLDNLRIADSPLSPMESVKQHSCSCLTHTLSLRLRAYPQLAWLPLVRGLGIGAFGPAGRVLLRSSAKQTRYTRPDACWTECWLGGTRGARSLDAVTRGARSLDAVTRGMLSVGAGLCQLFGGGGGEPGSYAFDMATPATTAHFTCTTTTCVFSGSGFDQAPPPNLAHFT